MPGWDRDDRKRLPEFYLSPAVKGFRIDPGVRSAMEQLWPWFWDHVGDQLGDPDRAADLAERVACGVTVYLKTHELKGSLGALCRVAGSVRRSWTVSAFPRRSGWKASRSRS